MWPYFEFFDKEIERILFFFNQQYIMKLIRRAWLNSN